MLYDAYGKVIGEGHMYKRPIAEQLQAHLTSLWTAEAIKGGKVIQKLSAFNYYMYEGAKHLFDAVFHGSAQITTWYVAPFSSNTTPNRGMTYATPTVGATTFVEFTDYSEAARQAFVEAAADVSTNTIFTTNVASKAQFTCTGGATIYGAVLVGGGSAPTTPGDTGGGGKMMAAVRFSAGLVVDNATVLAITIQPNLTI